MKRRWFYPLFALMITVASLSLWWPPVLVEASTKYDAFQSGDDTGVDVYGGNQFAQTFTAADTFTLTSVKLKLWQIGDPTDGTVSLRSTDSLGHPSTADILAETSFGATSITHDTGGNWYEVTLDSTVIIQGIKYAIVLECNSGDNVTYLGWRDDTANGYADGNQEYTTDGGITWTAEAGDDLLFSCWGEEGGETYQELFENYVTADDTDQDVYSDNWAAQSFTTDNTAHSVDKVRLKLQGHGDPGEFLVSIRATDNVTGQPTGLDLCYGVIDGNTLDDGSAAWYWIPMDETLNLEVETMYAIVARAAAGDGANKVHWRYNSAGTYSGGIRLSSDDVGVTWTDETGDLMFEIWGADSIRFMSAKVFTSYSQPGDWLIGVNYYAQVPPAYPTEETGQYLSLVLRTPGGTAIAKTQLPEWGNGIASLYLSKKAIALMGLHAKTAYVLSIEPTSLWTTAPNPAIYPLEATDWLGTNEALLDSWVRTIAQDMEDSEGSDIYTETTPAGAAYPVGKGVLTTDGARIFLAGIPNLDQEHPQLFYGVTYETGPSHKVFTHTNVKTPNNVVGGYIYSLLGQWGSTFNMSGTLFGAVVMLCCMIGAIGVNVARHGDPKVGVLAAIPIAIIGFYPGFWPWALACLIGMLCTFLVLQVTILRHG